MEKPDIQELKALAGLEHEPRFIKVMDWFRRCLEVQHRTNDLVNEDYLLRRGQGKSSILSEIIDIADDASKKIRRITKT